MSNARLGIVAALAATTSWGVMFPVLKHLLTALDPYWLTSIRYLGACAILVVWLLLAEGPRAFILDKRGWLLWLIGTAGITVFNVFVLTGLEHGSLLVATGPALVAVLLWVRGRTAPSRTTLAMIVLAFIGVSLVITKGSFASLAGGPAAGDGLVAVGIIGFALYTAYSPAFDDMSRLRFTTLTLLLGTISTVAVSIVAQLLGIAHAPGAPDASIVIGMIYMIVLPAVLAFIFWSFAIRAIGAQNTGLFMNFVPVVAFIIGIVQGHAFSPIEYGGAALTIGALVLNNLHARSPATSSRESARPSPASLPDRSRQT